MWIRFYIWGVCVCERQHRQIELPIPPPPPSHVYERPNL